MFSAERFVSDKRVREVGCAGLAHLRGEPGEEDSLFSDPDSGRVLPYQGTGRSSRLQGKHPHQGRAIFRTYFLMLFF